MLLAAEIVLAVLAVFGLYAVFRLIVSAFFAPPDLAVALEIRRPLNEEETTALLSFAREHFFVRGVGRTVALIDASLVGQTALRERLEAAGAACFYVDFND